MQKGACRGVSLALSCDLVFLNPFIMERETSWESHSLENIVGGIGGFNSFLELGNERDKGNTKVSVDLILPDDLLELILAYLPIASIFRVGCVCKRWNEIVSSKRFLWNFKHSLPKKPWYFMFTNSDEPTGYAFDPLFRKWYSIELPYIETSNWFIASSCGLVCFMNNDSRSELYVCNPITRYCRRLDELPVLKFSDYSAMAISVEKASRCYNVTVVKSKQVPGNFYQWELSIHIYESETKTWATPLAEVLTGWRGCGDSVICNGVLFFLICSTGGGMPENRHGLVTYNLSGRLLHDPLMRGFVPMPCPLTCARLMNLKEKLVMVGGIGKQDRQGIIKGIGIWLLNGKVWQEISRMPHKYFQGFGEFDDVFASSGTGDLIYIQSYGAPALLVFDFNQKQWKWSQKCPVTKRFPLQLFTGFSFEPRLETEP
ncbi:hypothetical protein ACET3Z_026434 [Daucus carota]